MVPCISIFHELKPSLVHLGFASGIAAVKHCMTRMQCECLKPQVSTAIIMTIALQKHDQKHSKHYLKIKVTRIGARDQHESIMKLINMPKIELKFLGGM